MRHATSAATVSRAGTFRDKRARTASRSCAIDDREEELARRFVRAGRQALKHALEPPRLHGREIEREPPALRGREQKPVPAVGHARPRLDEILIDEILHHAVEALLGDAEDVEQPGDRHARLARHEMEHPMMRAAEPVVREQPVGVRRRNRDRRRKTVR